jgi:hypothetical protein
LDWEDFTRDVSVDRRYWDEGSEWKERWKDLLELDISNKSMADLLVKKIESHPIASDITIWIDRLNVMLWTGKSVSLPNAHTPCV